MVLEKAAVLLNSEEFSALALLLDEYRSRSIGVSEFTSDLSQMLSDNEKVGGNYSMEF